jgi:hypothetical protein
MDIVLFQEITTEQALQKLEEEGKKYKGLFVDMNDKGQRKYVKHAAQFINDTLKKLDRARIDMAKNHKISIEAEAKTVRERLEAANLPFTMLIDAHKHERAEILAKEKAEVEAAALVIQIEADHEHAILMDKVQLVEALERERDREAERQRIESEAAARAVQQEKERVDKEAKRLDKERQQREADKDNLYNLYNVRKAAKEAFMAMGIDEKLSRAAVLAIHRGEIPNVTITY